MLFFVQNVWTPGYGEMDAYSILDSVVVLNDCNDLSLFTTSSFSLVIGQHKFHPEKSNSMGEIPDEELKEDENQMKLHIKAMIRLKDL